MIIASSVICDRMDKIYCLAKRVMEFYHYGIQESAYHAGLEWELRQNGFVVESEQMFNMWYRGIKLDKTYKMDLVINHNLIIELKAKEELTSEHRLQLFNYMRLVNIEWGLLINFSPLGVDIERYRYYPKDNIIKLFDRYGNAVFNN